MNDEFAGATPDVEEEELQPSMDDTLREALAGLRERGVAEAGEEEGAQRSFVRDEQGRFAPVEANAQQVASPEAQPAEAQAAEAPAAEPAIAPPNSWRREAAAEWAKVPPAVQQEIARREADFHRGIDQYRNAAQFAHAMHSAIEPHLQTLQQLGVTPDRAVAELMNADARLRYSAPEQRVQYFAHLAQQYGVDLAQLSQYQPAPAEAHVNQLQQQVQQLTSYLQQQHLMGQQQEDAALHSEIARFAADPSHSHFEEVRQYMGALMTAGLATSLDDAYAQAVHAHPKTRAAVAQQQAQAQREVSARKAQEARRAASVNVRRRPAQVPSEPAAGQTMEDTLRQAYARMQLG